MDNKLLSKCWFLAGPTACGKTAVSLYLAERINAEIIALDSMTLYRGMDIGTAKPTAAERSRIPHHLIDILEPEDEFSLADYVSAAEKACVEIESRGRIPMFVGGTGLYLRGLLRGVFEGPGANWTIRNRLEDQSRIQGPIALHDQLRKVDPISAGRLHPNDQRRVIRALEVFELTGQPLSTHQQQGPRPVDQRPQHVFWLSPPRDWLYRRINLRVEQMFSDGLVDEVRNLQNRKKPLSNTARQGLGYKEVIDWLEANSTRDVNLVATTPAVLANATVMALQDIIQTRTRQFAKRQQTWFRNLEECRPVAILGRESPQELADLIADDSLGNSKAIHEEL